MDPFLVWGQLEEKVVVMDVGAQCCIEQLETVEGEKGGELVGDGALVGVVNGQGHGQIGSWSGSACLCSLSPISCSALTQTSPWLYFPSLSGTESMTCHLFHQVW